MLSYVLFSDAAFDFPIHTLRLLHSLALASQFTLCTPFASVLSGFSTNTNFNVSFVFSRRSRHVSRNARGQGHAGPFHETIHLKRTDDTLMYPTMPRLSRHCLWFGRYLKPFVYDTTVITLLITKLYHFNHPYCLNGNQGIDLLAASIIIIVTGIYNSR